ncbi:hypothetical protein [Phytoactinopolyspora limicola]|uniref:hypothetical protein n=1 Tax=Phytoactinopolyspora limicola TaxID=2715536 RepID=UPI00140CBA81|nr:hypothetical protein [Phytoactinopolyspora limicola]
MAMLAITGCMRDAEQAMTEEEALTTVDQHALELAEAAGTDSAPEPRPRFDVPCDDRSGRHNGLYQVERRYWLDNLPIEDNQQTFDDVYTFWSGQGYDIIRDVRDRELARVLTARTDGFTIRLLERDDGRLSIKSTSPCIRTSESPSDT